MAQDGVVRVEDLLRSPALQLRLLAGEPGVSRRVAWAHVSELEDPTPWLFGSEMIMTTGIAIPHRRRFEQITGRSLASTEALAETWLALRAAATLLSEP
jgi:hypothetical protein